MTEPTYKPTEPEGTLDDAIAYATEWIETPGDEETVNWLRKLQSDNAAFSKRNVELELEVRRVKQDALLANTDTCVRIWEDFGIEGDVDAYAVARRLNSAAIELAWFQQHERLRVERGAAVKRAEAACLSVKGYVNRERQGDDEIARLRAELATEKERLAATDRLNSTLLAQAGRHVDDLASVAERQREACAQVCDFFGYPIVGGKVRSTRLVTAPAPEKPKDEANGAERLVDPETATWIAIEVRQCFEEAKRETAEMAEQWDAASQSPATPMVPATELEEAKKRIAMLEGNLTVAVQEGGALYIQAKRRIAELEEQRRLSYVGERTLLHRIVELELEIRRVKGQRERLRESLGLLASPLKLQPILREHIDALLKETAE